MIDLNDPSAVCRSIGYFLDFLTLVGPVAGLLWFTFFVLGGARK